MTSRPEDSRCISTDDVSAEQAADLAALRATVEEGEGAGQAALPVPDQGPGLGEEICGYLYMFVQVAGKAFPALTDIYKPEICAAAGEAVASLCKKHGWLEGGLGGEYKEEIAAAIVLLPLSFATYRAIKADIGPKPVSVTEGGAVGVGSDSKAVTFG